MAADHDVQRASEYLRLALPYLSRYAVPVTPRNYAVWYEYVAGDVPELRASIDRLVAEGHAIDARLTGELWATYVASADERGVEHARSTLSGLLDEIDGSVEAAEDDVRRYQESLAGYAGRLSGEVSEGELRSVVADLAVGTESVRATGQRLQTHLEESRREAEALRAALDRARIEAMTDPLTGVANRKGFDLALGRLALTAPESGSPGHCLLLADIDRFKRVNDTYGHLLGDKVIRFVASTLMRSVKGKDIVCRFGGDEFAVLLPDTPLAGAVTLAEAVRAAVEAGRVVRSTTKEPLGAVTVSVGVAALRVREPARDVVARADATLYRAKHAGRNRVVVEDEVDDAPPLPLEAHGPPPETTVVNG